MAIGDQRQDCRASIGVSTELLCKYLVRNTSSNQVQVVHTTNAALNVVFTLKTKGFGLKSLLSDILSLSSECFESDTLIERFDFLLVCVFVF